MWLRMNRFLVQFAAGREGVTAILFGIMLIPLMFGIGAAVDYSRAIRVKQHLGRALDSAALAIGSMRDLDDAELTAKAQAFFDANYFDANYNAYGFATSGHLGATDGSQTEIVLAAKTTTLCANIKDRGIRLYAITFQVSSTSTRDLMRDCATELEMYYDSPSGEELNTVSQDIAKGFADLRISK